MSVLEVLAPARHPCASCPYRRDVPSGVWDAEEYEKLPEFDDPGNSLTVFLCHQQNGRLCAGWVGCHDMSNMLGLRIATSMGMPEDVFIAALDYDCPVPLFDTGAEAAAHGMEAIRNPPVAARRTITKIEARRERRGL